MLNVESHTFELPVTKFAPTDGPGVTGEQAAAPAGQSCGP
jgi:hypothetical protein